MAEPLPRTLSGRAIIAGVAVKLLVSLLRLAGVGPSTVIAAVDFAAGVAIAAGAAYFFVQLFLLAKRRLLWRVRRKLILSYILIGVVPAILIAAFFLLGALLLFFNFSSYLVQTEMASLNDRMRLLSREAALEIQRDGGRDVRNTLNRAQTRAASGFPGLSMAVVPDRRTCDQQGSGIRDQGSGGQNQTQNAVSIVRAGPWTHIGPPAAIPAWITCDGFAGVFVYAGQDVPGQTTAMVVRGVAFPESTEPGYAVIVDLPVADALKARLRQTTGVGIRGVRPVEVAGGLEQPIGAGGDTSPSGPLSWVTFLDDRD